MIAIMGYYDGASIQLLEQAEVKKNQKVIVTIMDDFLKEGLDEKLSQSSEDAFSQALQNDKFVIPTDLNADEYIKELREDDRI